MSNCLVEKSSLFKNRRCRSSRSCYRHVGVTFSFYAVIRQPLNQFLPCLASLLNPLDFVVLPFIFIRRAPEIKPVRVSAERGAISRAITRHYASRYLNIHRHDHMVFISVWGDSYPSLIARPKGKSCPDYVLEVYVEHVVA